MEHMELASEPKLVGLSQNKCSSVVIFVMFPDCFPTKGLQQAKHGRREKPTEKQRLVTSYVYMCGKLNVYKSIETLQLKINGPFVKLCVGTSSKIFITDKSVDVFSGGKEFDLHRHDP